MAAYKLGSGIGAQNNIPQPRTHVRHIRLLRRTNGSRRKPNGQPKLIHRWTQQGITVGCMNVRGLTYLKLLAILD